MIEIAIQLGPMVILNGETQDANKVLPGLQYRCSRVCEGKTEPLGRGENESFADLALFTLFQKLTLAHNVLL